MIVKRQSVNNLISFINLNTIKMWIASLFSGFCLIGLLMSVKLEYSAPFFKTKFGDVFLLPVANQHSVAHTKPGRVSKIWCSSICSRNDDCHYFHMTSDSCVVIGYHWLEGIESDLVLQTSDVIYAKDLGYKNISGKYEEPLLVTYLGYVLF